VARLEEARLATRCQTQLKKKNNNNNNRTGKTQLVARDTISTIFFFFNYS